ncbi:MAG: PQQ-binding-like beta-propeller repeat protein [Sphingomonadales bacterium]|nr:PQQ-binding-like beta-propeller repeat protein [Sphingomonadales bacterium]MDE2168403.1 PQQ-binding-like beta-propeller repeat protein [Sphingomonadales bacterium]
MTLILRAGVSALLMTWATTGAIAAMAAPDQDWSRPNGDGAATRFSRAGQITPANIGHLRQAWVFHMKPATAAPTAVPSAADQAQAAAEQAGPPPGAPPAAGGAGARRFPAFFGNGRFSASETAPLIVGGTMYVATPYNQVVALNAATGEKIWSHDLPKGVQPARRGMDFWPGEKGQGAALFFGGSDGRLYALRIADGQPSPGFGEKGSINLRTPDVMVTGMNKPYSMTSPPVIWGHLVITGSAVGEGIGGAVGDVRAWDARTGKLVWTVHSVPRPGEPNTGSWAGESGHNRSGVNVWGEMTVDAKRGIVYLPFGAPADDRVGVDRPGNNLYGSSVVAVDAATGRYIWHFQVVHHDIWDNDTETPPMLFDVKHGGKVIPAVGIFSKNQMLFILNRVTGKPIYGVEERPVPKSDVPGEITSPTQPFPVLPAPLAQMSMTTDQLSKITPEQETFCRKLVADNAIAMGGPYNPPTYNRPMVYMPGTIGALFGGSFDPARGLYIVNISPLGQIQEIMPNGQGGFYNMGPVNGRFWNPATRMPCQSGSWGDLVAVNVNTGKIAWRSRLGVTDSLPAALQATGRPSAGGPTSTAGGVTFIGATDDARFRAFDTKTGKEIWSDRLPAPAHSVPVSYSVKGRQYVAIVATGGSFLGTPVTSDSLIVYSLR